MDQATGQVYDTTDMVELLAFQNEVTDDRYVE